MRDLSPWQGRGYEGRAAYFEHATALTDLKVDAAGFGGPRTGSADGIVERNQFE